LIYLDPPFNSNRGYNYLYSQATGLPLPEEAEAFYDAWDYDLAKEEAIANMKEFIIERTNLPKNFLDFLDGFNCDFKKH
jgi:site-specific DNA-methyltransferase (adenine-specific)